MEISNGMTLDVAHIFSVPTLNLEHLSIHLGLSFFEYI